MRSWSEAGCSICLNLPQRVFHTPAVSKPSRTTSGALAEVQVQLLPTAKTRARACRLLAKHHYLGEVRAVREQLIYAITDVGADWLGMLVFCAASRRLHARDRWIGWSQEQRRRLTLHRLSAEAMDFPCAAQVALLRRKLRQHSPPRRSRW